MPSVASFDLDQFSAELRRVVSALRRMPAHRLGIRLPEPWGSRAEAARRLARELATVAQGFEEAARPQPPTWRELPVLPDTGLGDQLEVLTHDLLSAIPDAPAQVWTPQGRAPREEVLGELQLTLAEVARLL